MNAVESILLKLKNNMYHTQQNKLTILVDPLLIHTESSNQLIHDQVSLSTIIEYLESIKDNNIEVKIIFPKYLWDRSWRENYYSFLPVTGTPGRKNNLVVIEEKKPLPEWAEGRVGKIVDYFNSKKEKYLTFEKISSTPDGIKKLLEKEKDGSLYLYRDADYFFNHSFHNLVDTYFEYECDLLLTSNRLLHKESKKLANDFRMYVTDFPKIFDDVETFLKGHHVYISHSMPIHGLQPSIFYPMTDTKLQQYQIAMGKIVGKGSKKETEAYQYFRGIFFHRYSFLRYSMDQIKFNMFQAKRLEDEKLRFGHYFLSSYHLNNFYLNLWGFIDNLAWVINHLYELGFDVEKSAMKVSFLKRDYLKKLKQKNINLYNLFKDEKIKKWFDNLSDKRHPAAHREPLFMSPIYNQEDMSLLAENLIIVNTKKGKGIFDAVNAMNSDFEQLIQVTDTILELLQEE
ncbi:MAG: hypothetical protein HOA85_00585 [Candidatus Pacebacteria bacterium]|jgi:hypothetical protein|nr:hypothetical protein [Candidatus Paceibacterota bacterium]